MSSKYAFYLLCFIIWFSPIPLGANRPWAWGLIELLICINTLLICFCYRFNQIFERLKQVKIILGFIVLVQIWIFMQWIGSLYPNLSFLNSLDPSQTEIALIKGITYCLFIINLTLLVERTERVKQLCLIIILSGLTQALYAIFLQYSGWEHSLLGFTISDRATGSFVYKNHLANYLVLCLSIVIGYLVGSLKGINSISQREKLTVVIDTLLSPKWLIRISIIIMVIALIMTRSRMGNSAFFISLLFTSFLALVFMKHPPNTFKWLILSLVIIDILVVGAYFGIEKVKERLEATSFQAEIRDDVVMDSIPYVQTYWLKGSGAGSFYSTFPTYQSAPYSGFYDHAHNEYFQFLGELGLILSLLLFALVVYVMWHSLTILRNSRSKFKQGLSFGVLMACIGMIMHCSVDFVLQDYAISLLFICILSLTFLIEKTSKGLKC
ncbi:O-antigen ligase domain-containing protein [Psychromonas sp. RZ22]|uniref:O-antigen ligase family protein n=1 Tax=Psychromonas algarum TaxID=2555643 RepID=UPI001068981F|nr:O-antigen ligase family protein [Psychromonas sp. RZ22]TEW56165.1 O-antigen ligase domain-containing protein [Psychromonas sp. RZ22]